MANVTAEEIKELLDTGLTKTEVGVELGITAQKVGQILAAYEKSLLKDEPLEVEVLDGKDIGEFAKTYSKGDIGSENEHINVLTAGEYTAYSKANGRFQGRKKDQKTKCTIEELRALINSGLKPKYIMDKHGISEHEFTLLVYKLSERELRDRPLRFNFEQDFIEVN